VLAALVTNIPFRHMTLATTAAHEWLLHVALKGNRGLLCILPGCGEARGCLGAGAADVGVGAAAGLDANTGRGCAVLFEQPNNSTATTSFTTRAAEAAPSGFTLALLNTCSNKASKAQEHRLLRTLHATDAS
jgi:hypothetical protein